MRLHLLTLLGALAAAQPGGAATPAILDALAGDRAALEARAQKLAADCARAGEAAPCYASAWAQYRIASAAFAGGEPAQAGPALVACASTLAAHQDDRRWGAEARALLAGCYGMSIALNPMKGMSLGPQIARLTDEALAAAPESPRAHLFAAQRYANTPTTWGGDVDKARAHTARGLELAARLAAEDAWGREDLAWLARRLADAPD